MTSAMGILDALILAGGRAARLDGADKPQLVVGGQRLLDHGLDAARALGARRIVVVGPPGLAEAPVLSVLEDPPFGGPVAGIAAGFTALENAREVVLECAGDPAAESTPAADWILLLACDLPRAPALAELLRGAASQLGADVDGVCVRDASGKDQWLAGIYRRVPLLIALARVRADVGVNASVGRLLGRLNLARIEDTREASADVDTWDDAARAGASITQEIHTERENDPRTTTETEDL